MANLLVKLVTALARDLLSALPADLLVELVSPLAGHFLASETTGLTNGHSLVFFFCHERKPPIVPHSTHGDGCFEAEAVPWKNIASERREETKEGGAHVSRAADRKTDTRPLGSKSTQKKRRSEDRLSRWLSYARSPSAHSSSSEAAVRLPSRISSRTFWPPLFPISS